MNTQKNGMPYFTFLPNVIAHSVILLIVILQNVIGTNILIYISERVRIQPTNDERLQGEEVATEKSHKQVKKDY
jgi:hypothetical protein